MTYTILDLYCGAGGAAVGYARAGFDVIGVDIQRQPRYPYKAIQCDALEYLDAMMSFQPDWTRFDAIHASPPCQLYSKMSACRPGLRETYPDLVAPTRERLEAIGLPYVIENVPGAPLRDPVWLCGCQFRCETVWPGKGVVQLRRKRQFETNWPLPDVGAHRHDAWTLSIGGHGQPTARTRYKAMPAYGHGTPGNRPDLRGPGYANAVREVMGISWMRRDELCEAIPPAFTEYIGAHLMDYLSAARERQAA